MGLVVDTGTGPSLPRIDFNISVVKSNGYMFKGARDVV